MNKLISAIEKYQKDIEDKFLSGEESGKINDFLERGRKVIESIKNGLNDFAEISLVSKIREKTERCFENLETAITQKKSNNIFEEKSKSILNSHGFKPSNDSKKNKKLAQAILEREIVKDLLNFEAEEQWIKDLKRNFELVRGKMLNLPFDKQKEIEQTLFAATVRDFSYKPTSKSVINKTEEICQKVSQLSNKKIREVYLRKQISEIWQSLSYIKASGNQLGFNFFNNKTELFNFSKLTGLNRVAIENFRTLNEGEYDEDIEIFSSFPVIYWEENEKYHVLLKSIVKEINIGEFERLSQNQPETEENKKKKLSEIEGWNDLPSATKEKYLADYKNGQKNFDQIKREIENKLDTENFTEFSQEAEQEAKKKESQIETELTEEIKEATKITDLDEKLRKIAAIDQKVNQRKYEEHRQEVEAMKKRAAEENATKTSQSLALNLQKQMRENKVSLTELNPLLQNQYNSLKNGEIQDPETIVKIEKEISQKIGEKGSTKRWEKLTEGFDRILQNPSGKKSDIKKALEDLILFSKSTNIWDQSILALSQWRKFENKLKSALNGQDSQVSTNKSDFPWQIALPVALGMLIIITIGGIVMLKKRKLKK